MTDDFERVAQALADGAAPAHLCATCPWERNCVSPPTMTKADVDKKIEEATAKDQLQSAANIAAGKPAGMPTGILITALAVAGKDLAVRACPVYVLRLRSSGGRDLVDWAKKAMQDWDDEA